eukprot:6205437-Pleurochrysis_carterae.AAC.3
MIGTFKILCGARYRHLDATEAAEASSAQGGMACTHSWLLRRLWLRCGTDLMPAAPILSSGQRASA